jgi:hypothetical protein
MPNSACADFFAAAPMGRREFLRAGTLGLFGLGLPQLLRAQDATPAPARRGRARSCIVLFMWGGPAQQETWDPKPDAPAEYRGEFRPIPTNVPGVRIGEHLSRLARHADKLAIIRSMTHGDVNHTTATHFLLTGRDLPNRNNPAFEDDWPSYGAVLSHLGRGQGPLPPFVTMMPRVPNGAPRFVEESHGRGAGLLGPRHAPLRIDEDASLPGYRVADFGLRVDVPAPRSDRRRDLLRQVDAQTRSLQQSAMDARDGHYERAFSLLSRRGVAEAFDLSREPTAVRERYGLNIHGQAVLQARRLVEAGVPLVTVFWQNDGITNVSVYWDTHSRNFIDLRTRLCPVADQAFSALLEDLQQRDMLDETLVVWTGEFGRTPRVGQSVPGGAGAGRDGRDHWAGVFSSVLAGGGVRGGCVHGASDRFAAYPSADPVRPADLAATVYHCLGIDPRLELRDRLNRPMTLCEGSPIQAILR